MEMLVTVVGLTATVITLYVLLRKSMREGFDRIDARFDKFEARTDSRFEKVETSADTRFDKIETSADTRFEKFEARFDKFEASADTRFDKVDARFEKFEASADARFDKMFRELSAIRADIVDLKVDVARLEGPRPSLIVS